MTNDSNVWVTELGRLLRRQVRRPRAHEQSAARLRVLDAWMALCAELGHQPTVRQIAARVGRSVAPVHYHLVLLRADGTIPPAVSAGKRGQWRRTNTKEATCESHIR